MSSHKHSHEEAKSHPTALKELTPEALLSEKLHSHLGTLATQVKASHDVQSSLLDNIHTLAEELVAAGKDPSKLLELLARLKALYEALFAQVQAIHLATKNLAEADATLKQAASK